jgi:hypothetical protein
MVQRLVNLLDEGLAMEDNRFMRVTADGGPWVVRPIDGISRTSEHDVLLVLLLFKLGI